MKLRLLAAVIAVSVATAACFEHVTAPRAEPEPVPIGSDAPPDTTDAGTRGGTGHGNGN